MLIGESSLRMGYITPQLAFESAIAPAINSFARDDVAMASLLNALKPTQLAQRRVTGLNQTSDSTTYADIANLAVAINRIGLVVFDYWLLYESSDVAEGIGVQVAFTGSANGAYSVETYTDPSTRAPLVTAAALGSGLAPYTAGPGPGVQAIVNMRGSCNVSAIGTLAPQVRAETGGANTVTVLINSWARVTVEPG